MRYSKDHKARTRQHILEESASSFKENGVDGTGVSTLMSRVGLTHGGFYAHFPSKNALVLEAVTLSFNQVRERLATKADAEPDATAQLIALIEQYLAVEHRDTPAQGCAVGALASDIARLPADLKAQFSSHVQAWLNDYAERAGDARLGHLIVTSMLGTIQLARIVSNDESIALLNETRATLIELVRNRSAG
ncbi:transcriptional regulator, TetR family [Pseudidiomarina planktonica]|uniref:Transcriptional regulator, TetR family n=1 Tax=Pseudidiomarina planktonica TaxID=1323738 RepID=A0A1Y6E979_9GAMM|nr:TetR/AcrR family transcriptional regulator [Pseudidiomarina planktonica]SMQ59157.1 transcriptional regulator, TetR family [Pseudidiomarina planktonica]